MLNPTKLVTTEVTNKSQVSSLAEIENSKWFSAAKYIPGQPGVFEVDPLVLDDSGQELRRFSYHNGRDFGPVFQSPTFAYANRFEKSGVTVTKFRGLAEVYEGTDLMTAALNNLGGTLVFRNNGDERARFTPFKA